MQGPKKGSDQTRGAAVPFTEKENLTLARLRGEGAWITCHLCVGYVWAMFGLCLGHDFAMVVSYLPYSGPVLVSFPHTCLIRVSNVCRTCLILGLMRVSNVSQTRLIL